MNCFVICRVINHEGDDGNDYLVEEPTLNGYEHWTESAALAKWYRSEEEAQDDLAKWSQQYPVCELRPYDPVAAMVNPSDTDRRLMVQANLREMLQPDWFDKS